MSEECYVYVIAEHCADPENDEVLLKVGISTDPTLRLKQIQTSCPFPVYLASAYRYPNRKRARYIEHFFHYVDHRARTHGEWFKAVPQIAINDLAYYTFCAWDRAELTVERIMDLCRWTGINPALYLDIGASSQAADMGALH